MHLLYVNAMTCGQGAASLASHHHISWAWPAREYRIPNNFKIILTIARACQYLLAEELLEHLADKLQVEPQMLWENPHSVKNLVQGRYRVANFKRQAQLPCFLCKGPFFSDGPCRAEVKQLPCCMGDVHHECFNNTCQQYYFNCPHCSCPLIASGVDHKLMGKMDFVYMRNTRQHVGVDHKLMGKMDFVYMWKARQHVGVDHKLMGEMDFVYMRKARQHV